MQSQATPVLFKPTISIPYEEVIVQADNAKLYCRVFGKGNPLIVVHGGPGLSMNYLLPGLEKLAEDHMVIFYDQRGNGKSTGVIDNETMNISKFVEDLHAIQNHFNLSTASFLGHSWGAYLAMDYATTYPERVSKLILLNSIPIYSQGITLTSENQDPYEEMIDKIINCDAFKNNDGPGMIKYYKDLFKFFFYDPALVNKLHLDEMSAQEVQNSALIHKLFEKNFFHEPHDLRGKLAKLDNVPTLVIHGDGHDIPESVAHEIQSVIKNSKLCILESGHFPYVEKPKELFESIKKFNQSLRLNLNRPPTPTF